MNIAKYPDLLDQLAASYALGTMRGHARNRFESIARQSPAVRASTLIWKERFSSLTELQPEEAPSANVWKRIENMLDAERPAVAVPVAAAAPGILENLKGLKRTVSVWRGVAWGSAMVAVFAGFLAITTSREFKAQGAQLASAQQLSSTLTAQLNAAPQVSYVAVLADDKQSATMLATFDPTQRTITLKRVGSFQEAPDKSLQLWALPPSGGPKSLGVLGDGAVLKLTSNPADIQQVPALAISLEPRGGAPVGSGPTGPVLFKGALLKTTL